MQEISNWQTDDEIIAILGERIRVRRIQNNLTQDELAKETGLTKLTIHKIEKGHSPKLESLIRILRFFGDLDKVEYLLSPQNISPKELYEQRSEPPRQRVRKSK